MAFGTEKMTLSDFLTGEGIVQAERSGCCGAYKWLVKAEGVEDRSAEDRNDAIDLMIDAALEALPGTGYSTFVPHSVRQLP